jgi:hypothetical protein
MNALAACTQPAIAAVEDLVCNMQRQSQASALALPLHLAEKQVKLQLRRQRAEKYKRRIYIGEG